MEEDWRERGHGMFLTRGMTAWVAAVQGLAPAAFKSQQWPADDTPLSTGPALPFSFREELTTLLAGMVLACCGSEKQAVG